MKRHARVRDAEGLGAVADLVDVALDDAAYDLARDAASARALDAGGGDGARDRAARRIERDADQDRAADRAPSRPRRSCARAQVTASTRRPPALRTKRPARCAA